MGVRAACGPGVMRVTAGNYGGKLGPHHFHLRRILGEGVSEFGLPISFGSPITPRERIFTKDLDNEV